VLARREIIGWGAYAGVLTMHAVADRSDVKGGGKSPAPSKAVFDKWRREELFNDL
jgi:hypothetical protein